MKSRSWRKWHHRTELAILAVLLVLLPRCTWENVEEELSHGYPAEIEPIMRQKCATTGCHNAQSAEAAGGLDLSTWDALFRGSRGGSAVVPYAPEMSFLLYAVNTDSTRGQVLPPTMPLNGEPLSAAEYETLRAWIADGARNSKGEERFPPRQGRRKWYVSNRGCDWLAVFDAESRQIMRYLKVGSHPTLDEEPYAVTISPDRQYYYLTLASTNTSILRFSAVDDSPQGAIAMGHNVWNSMDISPDGRWGFVSSGAYQEVAVVDLAAMTLAHPGYPTATNILEVAAHPALPQLYLTIVDGSALLLANYASDGSLSGWRTLDLVQGRPSALGGDLWPYDILFSPDGSRYFVSCWQSGEVRVLDAATDSLLEVIVVGAAPTGMAVDAATNRLFVACMEETAVWGGDPQRRGAVAVVNLATAQVEKHIYAGYQPHGIAVDAASGMAVVTCRNLLPTGPGQHHTSACLGRNGSLSLIDLSSGTTVAGFKAELSVDPFAVTVGD